MSEQELSTDANTTLGDLRELVREFVEERNWKKFHSPKNLSMALAIEAGELMEHFQWISMDESRDCRDDAEKLQEVSEELADCMCYLLAMANQLNLDISTSLLQKMKKNRLKYPAQEFQGRYGHKQQRSDVDPSQSDED